MDLVLVLLAAAVFPVVCLAFLLWMSRIEDAIPAAVRRATRTPDPLPVLAIPVRVAAPGAIALPEQRREPVVPGVGAAAPATPAPTGT